MKIKQRKPNALGYVELRVAGHPSRGDFRTYEHRYLMERKLRRRLRPGEIVHHKNGNPSDNRLENLEVLSSNGEHLRRHFTGKKMPKEHGERARRYMLSLPFEERRKRGVKGGANSGPGLRAHLATLTPAQRKQRVSAALKARGVL